MNDLGQLKILLSAIFCFVGSCALLVSYSVCGHNLFKDMASRQSLFLAGFIGFWLFVLSPVSFIILFPNLFIHATLINDPEQTANLVRAIHVLLERCILPFIVSAVGLGVMFGALSEIKPRKTILQYLNRSLGLNLRQFSYDFAWDSFFRGIKNSGIITLVLEGKVIKGQLRNHSVVSEPKQVIMEDCTVTEIQPNQERCSKHHCSQILITEFAQIKEVRAESSSLKKHHHELNHCAQTTYYIMAGIGSLLLVNSLNSSSDFLAFGFSYVTYFYDAASLSFLFLSVIFFIFAIRALRHDFSSYRAALIFYPVLTMLIAAFVLAILCSAIRTGISPKPSVHTIASVALPVITLSTIIVFYAIWFNRKIHRSLQDVIRPPKKNAVVIPYSHIKNTVKELYLAVDFNNQLPIRADEVVKNISNSDQDLGNNLLEAAGEVFKHHRVLSQEHANIIMKWHHILRSDLPKKLRWWWPSPLPDVVRENGFLAEFNSSGPPRPTRTHRSS